MLRRGPLSSDKRHSSSNHAHKAEFHNCNVQMPEGAKYVKVTFCGYFVLCERYRIIK